VVAFLAFDVDVASSVAGLQAYYLFGTRGAAVFLGLNWGCRDGAVGLFLVRILVPFGSLKSGCNPSARGSSEG